MKGSLHRAFHMKDRAYAVGQELLSWLFPFGIYCICCGDFITVDKPYGLCDVCAEKLHWITGARCNICGKELAEQDTLCYDCEAEERHFDRGMSCVQYGRLEKELIHRFKYKDCGYLGRPVGDLMAERFLAEAELPLPDMITAVPMYRKKEQVRGYNQAAVIGKNVAKRLDRPYCADLLHRIRNTEPMNRLHAEERKENVKNAFHITEKYCTIVNGRVILLVDDVYTTGSTADTCARLLKEAGAKAVIVLSFASGADREKNAVEAAGGTLRL